MHKRMIPDLTCLRSLIVASSSVACLMVISSAQADDAASTTEASNQIEEVIVTAEKRDTNISNAPIAITAVKPNELVLGYERASFRRETTITSTQRGSNSAPRHTRQAGARRDHLVLKHATRRERERRHAKPPRSWYVRV